jgi:hypothetical protein
VGLPAEAEVFLGETPDASLATSNDGSTTTEGTLCLVVASSLAALSSAPCFERFGSEASGLEKKIKGESVQKPDQEEVKNVFVMVWKHLP